MQFQFSIITKFVSQILVAKPNIKKIEFKCTRLREIHKFMKLFRNKVLLDNYAFHYLG